MGIRTESDGTVPPQGLDVRTALRALREAAEDTNARLFSVIMLSACGSVAVGVTSFFLFIHFSLSETHGLGEYLSENSPEEISRTTPEAKMCGACMRPRQT
jgi:hypothetical protein